MNRIASRGPESHRSFDSAAPESRNLLRPSRPLLCHSRESGNPEARSDHPRSLFPGLFPRTLAIALFLLSSASFAAAARPLPKKRNTPILIAGITLIDGTGAAAAPDTSILVRDGRIAEIFHGSRPRALPPHTVVMAGAGKWMVPGFVDAHVHVESSDDTKAMIRWGVTSVRLMAEGVREAEAAARHSRTIRRTPELFPAAPIFTTPGGWWATLPADPDLDRIPSNPEIARTAVRRAKELGSSEIKIMNDDMGWCRDPQPKLAKIPAPIRSALVAEARRMGLRVAVHAPRLADAADAVEDGATVLAHGIIDAPVGDELAGRMHEKRVFFVPTMDIFDFLADPRAFMGRALSDPRIRESLSKKTLERYRSDAYFRTYAERYPNAAFVASQLPVLRGNVKKLKDAGVEVALGTDMWAFPGAGVHLELEDFVTAGFSPLEAIRAATLVSARSLGADGDRGTIETGKRADFVVLENDPLRDIRNTRSIERVFKGGKVAWSRYKTDVVEE